MQIVKSLEDGGLAPDEAADLLEIMCEALKKVRPLIRKFWLRIIIDGVMISLQELQEHLEQCDKENATDCR
jgi:hypothetical protein|tara:strand:+ start:2978 stop:3190 length:213 start_codon:yes stop_codon:yes gene_type:complete